MRYVHHSCVRVLALTLLASVANSAANEPLLTSWFTELSGRHARIFETADQETAGNAVTIWSHGQGSQLKPAFAGIYEVTYTANDVYVRSSGLAFYTMGPWYLNAGQTNIFPNYPAKSGRIFRFPRTPGTVPAANAKIPTHLGDIGMFVDGVAMYNSLDAFSYSNADGQDAGAQNGITGDDVWHRDAFINEGVTFDAGNAHQGGSTYHYHANPPGLRHQLGDSVDYNAGTNTYTENFNGKHSPILGWMKDGYPLYGPYGYSDPNDENSTVRRMISGYQPRNMPNGTARTSLPQWVNTLLGDSTTIPANHFGPNVSTDFPVGKYAEDYEYRGDVGDTISVDFDLDLHNGRFCKTPEFPGGTYAYFVAIDAVGTPIYPYNIGGAFYGDASGAPENSIPLAVQDGGTAIRYFRLDPGEEPSVSSVSVDESSGDVTLIWDAAEGGSYKVETSADGSSWSELPVKVAANSNTVTMTDGQRGETTDELYYRARLDTLREFDDEEMVYSPVANPAPQTVITVTLSGGGATPPPTNLSILPSTATFDGNAVAILSRPSQFEITIAVPTSSLAAATYAVAATWPDSGTWSANYTHEIHNNVLLLIADDWGIDHSPLDNTTGPGKSFATMANFQNLAAGGVRFTHAYANPSCSPTRSTILTGRQAFRTSVGSPPGTGFSQAVDEITLPDVFASNNAPHQLASFGKWHLGGGNTGYFDRGGWPYFAGSNDNIDNYTAWAKNRNGIASTATDYSTTNLVDEAKAFIDAQERVGKPWVVWMGFHAPHDPFHNPPNNLLQGGGAPPGNIRQYIRMLEAMDTEIGRLLQSVDQSRTNIILIGDNGSPNQTVQDPYGTTISNGVNPPSTRAKGTLYEGGTRVPLVIKGPAVTIAPNSTSDKLVNSADLYATILEMAGLSVPVNAGQDSVSLVPILQGTDTANRYASSEIFDETTADVNDGRSIRLSDHPNYKLLANGNPNDRFDDPRYEFYDISIDPNEASNLTPNGTGPNALVDARGDLSGAALIAFDACIAKHQALGGGFSDPSAGVPQTLYIELPNINGPDSPPQNLGVDPDTITVDGVAADYLGRLDQTDTAARYWIKCIVPQTANYNTAVVDFPDNPNTGDDRLFNSIQIVVP